MNIYRENGRFPLRFLFRGFDLVLSDIVKQHLGPDPDGEGIVLSDITMTA